MKGTVVRQDAQDEIKNKILNILADGEGRWVEEIYQTAQPLPQGGRFWYAFGALLQCRCIERNLDGFRITGCGRIAASVP